MERFLKRGVLCSVVIVLFSFFVSAQSNSCAGDAIFSISAPSNAHADSIINYPFELCYSDYFDDVPGSITGDPVIRLSSTTNAHVEGPGLSGAGYAPVSYGDLTNCQLVSGSTDCGNLGSDFSLIASLSGTTNAHVALGHIVPGYGQRLCCSTTGVSAPLCNNNGICEPPDENVNNCEDCTVPVCGNGATEPPGEQCDDGNTVPGDGCSATCQIETGPIPQCSDTVDNDGDGLIDFPADPGCVDANDNDEFNPTGGGTFCGDGTIQAPNDDGEFEQCDDGGECVGGSNDGIICNNDGLCPGGSCVNQNGDGCDVNCMDEPPTDPYCGDGILNGGEACDNNDWTPGITGCDFFGFTSGTLTCYPAGTPNDECTFDLSGCFNAQPSVCGNGILEPGEECEDGNTDSGDGCSDICVIEPPIVCGDGIRTQTTGPDNEECDDGNTVPDDGCDEFCQLEDCGDGFCDPDLEDPVSCPDDCDGPGPVNVCVITDEGATSTWYDFVGNGHDTTQEYDYCQLTVPVCCPVGFNCIPTSDGSICAPDGGTIPPGDFCTDFTLGGFPIGGDVVDPGTMICTDINDMTDTDAENSGFTLLKFKEMMCLQCANGAGIALNQYDPTIHINPRCEWTGAECEFAADSISGDGPCTIVQVGADSCDEDDTTRQISFRDTCNPLCALASDPPCTVTVPCRQTIQLPFFTMFNFILTMLMISLIYIFQLTRRK